MSTWRGWLGAVCLLLPSFLLAAAGIVELRDGWTVDAAFPVPSFLSNNRAMPKRAYADAAAILAGSDSHDGNAQISLAESMFHAGDIGSRVLPVMERGLKAAPASAEGWAYYAAMLAPSDPAKAGRALDQAFSLAPYDYFLAAPRARLGALLWPSLDDETRNEVLRQARMLWEEPSLRDELMSLSATADGARLVTRAFAGAPATIRDINRWAEAHRPKSPPQGS